MSLLQYNLRSDESIDKITKSWKSKSSFMVSNIISRWIVVAPNRKNNFGRFIEHVGYWSPRQGVHLQRQVVFNIPRVCHWIANGAVPTYRVHKFLSLWGILPNPWYFPRPAGQTASPPTEQLTDKQKRKLEWKQRKKHQTSTDPMNFTKQEGKSSFLSVFERKMKNNIQMQQRQNQIIRRILLKDNFHNIQKIKQLSSKEQTVSQLTTQLNKARSDLASIKSQYQNSHIIQKIKIMKIIANLEKKVEQAQNSSIYKAQFQQLSNQKDTVLPLKYQVQVAILAKKINKTADEMAKYSDLHQPVTITDLADFMMEKFKGKITASDAIDFAQRYFIQRGKSKIPVTKLDILSLKQPSLFDSLFYNPQSSEINYSDKNKDQDHNYSRKFKKQLLKQDRPYLANTKPVNPFPDVKSYIPEEYYEPVLPHNIQMVSYNALQPYQELQKYHKSVSKTKK